MGLKEKFLESLKLLPDLKNKYFPGDFFFNFYGNSQPVRIGCRYSSSSLAEKDNGENYLVILEIFNENPRVEFLDSEKNGDLEIIYGHIPEFPLTKKYLNEYCNFASILRENVIYTIINLKKSSREIREFDDLPGLYSLLDAKKDKKLKNFLRRLLDEKKSIKSLPIFEFLDYLPEKSEDWRLVTFFCYYLNREVNGENHLISNIQGNYEKEGRYLNLVLRFIYKMSEGKVNIEEEGIEENLGDIKIKRKKAGNILNISHFNKRENFTVITSNNETTLEFERYEKDMKNLLLAALKKLKNYSCVEQTMKFIAESREFAASGQK